MCGKYSLTKFANCLIIVLLYVRKLLPLSALKMVAISARNTIFNEKICKLCKAIFSAHYNIFQPKFGILLLLKGSFQEFVFFVWICLDKKISL